MVTLLEATRKSEEALRQSLLSYSKNIESLLTEDLLKYKQNKYSIFDTIKNVAGFHENLLLRQVRFSKKKYTSELMGGDFLKESEIEEFYTKGYISQIYKFPNVSNNDLLALRDEYVNHVNNVQSGFYEKKYSKFPDYVGHLYLSSVVKLLKNNYDYIVKKCMSIFNVDEDELFFSVGLFVVDESEKGVNVHQDYAYYLLDQTSPQITTPLITFHMAVSNVGASRLSLFTGTHKAILHNLTTLKYLVDHNIDIDEKLAMYCGCISNYIINKNILPYDDKNNEILTLSRISRYPQLIYILDLYKNNDIEEYQVKTEPGEFVLFDPALFHSNGASMGNINELNKNLKESIDKENISRLSIGIRVMHTRKENNHFLWMAALEKAETLWDFLDLKCKENNKLFSKENFKIRKKSDRKEFYTVLSNNKLNSSSSPWFSVNEMYNFHEQSGAYHNQ